MVIPQKHVVKFRRLFGWGASVTTAVQQQDVFSTSSMHDYFFAWLILCLCRRALDYFESNHSAAVVAVDADAGNGELIVEIPASVLPAVQGIFIFFLFIWYIVSTYVLGYFMKMQQFFTTAAEKLLLVHNVKLVLTFSVETQKFLGRRFLCVTIVKS